MCQQQRARAGAAAAACCHAWLCVCCQPQPLLPPATLAAAAALRRATPLDIFNFFDSYDVIAESLQLGVDALGRPSGEAWLTFGSSEEALRAVRERNRHYLGNRYLELSLT